MENKNKPKMLFLCIPHFDLYKIFEKGFSQYGGYDVKTILHKRYTHQYNSTWERVVNFFSKAFLRKNLKSIKTARYQLSSIEPDEKFDVVFVICPEMFHPWALEYATSKGRRSIVYYWDGFDHFPAYKNTLKHFKEQWTFDPADAQKYNLQFTPNFYYHEQNHTESTLDAYFVGTFDGRYPMIKKIAQSLIDQGQKIDFKLLIKNPDLHPGEDTSPIEIIEKPVPVAEAEKFTKRSKYIIDVHKPIQQGLSLRVFEAMGCEKKLITTNGDVQNYDFYRPENIFIWTTETTHIPLDFLCKPYKKIPKNIKEKYSQKQWVSRIINEGNQKEFQPSDFKI